MRYVVRTVKHLTVPLLFNRVRFLCVETAPGDLPRGPEQVVIQIPAGGQVLELNFISFITLWVDTVRQHRVHRRGLERPYAAVFQRLRDVVYVQNDFFSRMPRSFVPQVRRNFLS